MSRGRFSLKYLGRGCERLLSAITIQRKGFGSVRSLCSAAETKFLPLANGKKLAYRAVHAREGEQPGPGIIFCPGFQSNMLGVKAMSLEEYCRKKGLSFIRFDYQGCGESSGDIREATLSDWRSDVLNVLDQLTAGPQIIVGSSMGGWLMLATALQRPHRVHALVGIATSAEFPSTAFNSLPADVKADLQSTGSAVLNTGDFSYVLTSKFVDDLRSQPPLGSDEILVTCPVRLLHGMQDNVVPFKASMEISEKLISHDVHVLLRKNSDHRFSQPDDIEMMFETLDYLIYGAKEARDLAINTWSSSSVSHQPVHMTNNPRIHQLNRD